MARKFFIGSVGKPGDGYDEENRKRCIAQNAHIMHEDTKQKGVFNNVKPGDICFLKYQHVIIAFGEVKNVRILTDESLDGWTHYIYVKQWFFYSNDKEHGVSKYGISEHTYGGAGQRATVKQLDPEFGLQKMKEIGGENNQLYKLVKSEYTMNQLNNEITRSLLSNHNLILTGAPGTGKTYLAKQIAQQLIFGEAKGNLTDDEQKQFDEQCGFVQFHPSYDYTDFVEGLRPIQDDNGNVGFERRDGVFKEFCKKAEKNWIDSKKSIDELQKEFYNKELIDSFLSNAINEETIYKTKTGTEFNIADFDDDRISIKILRNKIRGDIDIDININKHKLVKLLENDLQLNNVRDIKHFFGYTNTQHRDSYIFTICNEIRNLPKVNSAQIDPIVCKNFVFIIDEINRGEISKIFGELFFSIDPGYRGENGKVRTQYANMQTVPNDFDDKLGITDDNNFGHFFVPENVYIIGTMNDIDRSVESMDFAFRRRFAFKEIKADESMKMLEELGELKDKAIERMKQLNAEISKIEGLSSAYHIGAAYFLKLKNYADDADGGFDNLWDNHIKGLLVEYLRGMQDADEKLEKLEKAYNDDKDHSKKDKDNSEENKDNESTENIG